jgi:high-affinity iron transporter
MSDDTESAVFSLAVATIFAREFLEGSLIVGNYRQAILRNDKDDDTLKKQKLRAVTISAAAASFVAVVMVCIVAIPLSLASGEFSEEATAIIEGISKVIGAIAIMQLSLKIPFWLGFYAKVSILPWKKAVLSHDEMDVGISVREIHFNVAWNIWREVAECGVFLIPFFLKKNGSSIPLSALVGIVIALVLGGLIYYANTKMTNKLLVVILMSGLMLFLSVGLMTGGLHEFEEVAGETPDVYEIQDPFFSSKKLPFAILKPFGYSSSRTILQMCTFWMFLAFGLALHGLKWHKTKIARANQSNFASGKEVDVENQDTMHVK